MPDSPKFPELPIDVALLDRYLANTATESERDAVGRWLATDAAHAELFAVLRTGYRSGQAPEIDVERALARNKKVRPGKSVGVARYDLRRGGGLGTQTLRGETFGLGTQPLQTTVGSDAQRLRGWIGVATVALIISCIVGLWPNGRHDAGRTHTYMAPAGQTATTVLPDGTRITLSPSSTLRLVNFGAHERSVMLEGEGYFDVSRATRAPFTVRSGGTMARVLGTTFLMRQSLGTRQTHIAVLQGKVAVTGPSSPASGIILTAGTSGDVTDSTIQTNVSDGDVSEVEWHNGEVVFRDMPVPRVLNTLKRWYGYHFRCTDSALTRQSVTVLINPTSSSSALAILEQILDVNLTVTGDTITLTPASKRTPERVKSPRTYDTWTHSREVGR